MVGRGPAGHGAESPVAEREGLDVGAQEAHPRRALGGRELAGGLDHRQRDVDRHHAGREAREGQGGVAAAGGDVEDPRGPALSSPGDELLQVGARGVARALDVGGRARPELGLHPRLLALAHVAAARIRPGDAERDGAGGTRSRAG